MTDELKNALTPYEWKSLGPNGVGHPPMPSTLADIDYLDAADLPKAIAIANAALPDDSAYKITAEDVSLLREIRDAEWAALWREPAGILAAKLAALLPPADLPPSAHHAR